MEEVVRELLEKNMELMDEIERLSKLAWRIDAVIDIAKAETVYVGRDIVLQGLGYGKED